MSVFKVDRRTLLVAGASGAVAAGAGLLLGIRRGTNKERWRKRVPTRAQAFAPSVFLAIDHDGTVTVWLTKAEKGQGVLTSLPMLVAEELEAKWNSIRIERAVANPNYGNQMTAVSYSIRGMWPELRRAGAIAKAMLISAAAQIWGVDASACFAREGTVVHEPTGRTASYGSLAEIAATLDVPDDAPLKDPKDFRIIGTRMPRLDSLDKVTGAAEFGIDIKRAKMVYATVARCPVFGGKVRTFDDQKAREVAGVIEVRKTKSGVAVLARNTWAAISGKRALKVDWDVGENGELSTEKIEATLTGLGGKEGVDARSSGDVDGALAKASKKVEATYTLPYLAHATMEPMNTTAHVANGRCEIWSPNQDPQKMQNLAAAMTGLELANVVVHTTFLGGGFGRRVEDDVVTDAIELAIEVDDPVQVVWTREEDTQHDWYRPISHHVMQGGLDAEGWPTVWSHQNVSPSILDRDPRFTDPVDPVAVEGGMQNPYGFENLRYRWTKAKIPVPLGFWRSVGHSHNALAVECFIDELAYAGEKSPIDVRRRLLAGKKRHLGVFERVVREAGPLATGLSRGFAVHESFGSFVAQAVDISIGDSLKVRRVVCAVDCGIVVNPDTVEAQMEGGIIFGLTAALYGKITLDKGRVLQSNFHDYRMLRFDESPRIEVHIVKSAEAPGGVGEIAVPPIAPAVANAVFAATGRPVRRLPIEV